MRRAVLFTLLLLVLPSASFAGPGALKWIEGSGYSQHSTKSGSSALVREITSNSNKKSFLYEVANETNNLAKKAAKAAGTGSKLGVAGAVGKSLVKGGKYGFYGVAGALILDLGANYAKDQWADYPLLKEILCQTLGMCPRDEPDNSLKEGDLFRNGNCGLSQVTSVFPNRNGCMTEDDWNNLASSGGCREYYIRRSTEKCKYVTNHNYKSITYDILSLQQINQSEDPDLPQSITPEQEEELSDNILKQLEKHDDRAEQLAEELNHIIQGNPDVILWDPLDNDEVKDSLYQDESDKLQQQKDEIERQLNDDPDNADLKKQLEEIERKIDELDSARNKEILDDEEKKKEEEQKEEEKFDPIGREDWEPYDPGPFDIPARFNRLINTIKGTSLFSFSSGFFESLPSGGSPIVHFQGGNTFGNHTIDLSDTMQVGLVAFRAVVMVIFGFLAIRAVIMKR